MRVAAAGLLVAVCAFLPYWAGYASVTSTVNEPGRGLNNLVPRVMEWALSFVTGGFYAVDDVVTYNGETWIALTNISDYEVPGVPSDYNLPEWAKLAAKGADGATGAAGFSSSPGRGGRVARGAADGSLRRMRVRSHVAA